MKPRLFVSLVPFLTLLGCATPPYIPPASTTHYQQILSLYTGKNITQVPATWPAPYMVPMAEGNQMATWSNTPRWGCSTIALADSSGTILSWQLKGDDCVMAYTDAEIQQIQAKLDALRALLATLKRDTHVRLSFYDGAVDSYSHRVLGDVDCYFISYSKVYGEITVRSKKELKHGFNLSKDNTIYELRYVSDITVLPDNAPPMDATPKTPPTPNP